jgi:solute carrier family 25 phosphate transporter 3
LNLFLKKFSLFYFIFIFASPVDVVKTRIQLDPVKYNRGLIGGFSQVIAEEGVMGLSTGLGPTVVGYFVQGKFY